MASLKARLTWGLMLSLIVLLTLQWAVVTYAINKLIETQLIQRLQREGETLLAGTHFDANGQLALDARRLSAIYQRPFSGHYYVIISDQQRQISRSLWDTNLHIEALKAGEKTSLYLQGPEQQPLLVVAHGYQKQQRSVTIAIGENLTALHNSMTRFQIIYALVSLAGLIVLLIIQRLIVTNALRPLRSIQESIVKLGRGEVSRIENNGPTEVAPLIEELNRLLVAMQDKSRRSRESLGNLAHALKTKLTLLNQAAERPELDAEPEIRRNIYAATEAIGQTIERELKRARLIGDTHPMRKVDLKTEIAQLTHTLRQMYADKAVNITWEISGNAQFHGDQEDLLEMLGNLLDNACKWCRRNVSLTVNGADSVVFIIEDDGPGCAESELNLLTRRGFRADESKPGSGLGLAIVYDIVSSYGADLTFGRSAALGGLRVEVRFKS
jgi:signal transduction histidine kinase